MAASRSDMNFLGNDQTFTGRVRASMIAAAVAIANEGWAVVWHKKRADFAAQIVGNPDNFKGLFASSVATDPTCVADATAAGTVALTVNNVAAQGALVTDAHIDAAVAAQWNAFLELP